MKFELSDNESTWFVSMVAFVLFVAIVCGTVMYCH